MITIKFSSLNIRKLWYRFASAAGNFKGSRWWRRFEIMRIIKQSGLFDADWYLAHYPDVVSAGLDPLAHFVDYGWREGRSPSPAFATSAYLKLNPDVARAGANPLLHYILFGQSEGREIKAFRPRAETAPLVTHDFLEAVPVYRGFVEAVRPNEWKRSCHLNRADPRSFTVGDLIVGLILDISRRPIFQRAFAELADLSGFGTAQPCLTDTGAGAQIAVLVDAWFCTSSQLRTRWRSDRRPLIIRAFQHDPSDGGTLKLVGEGAIDRPTAFVDLNLANPHFPTLLVFASADGLLLGNDLLTFPSLCRGGLHYPELIATGSHPVDLGRELAKRLGDAIGDPARLVGLIQVDEQGADGTSPLFEAGFQQWVERVARLGISECSQAVAKVGSAKSKRKPTSGGILLVPADAIPTISVIAAKAGDGACVGKSAYLPLAVAGSDPSQPITVITRPESGPEAIAEGLDGYCTPWPRLVMSRPMSLPVMSSPAAIRLTHGRRTADAEILVPAMGPLIKLPAETAPQVTWFVFVQNWQPDHLVQSLIALAGQIGSEAHRLILIGETYPECLAIAHELFTNRLDVIQDLAELEATIRTSTVGYLGAGVILHDDRTALFLSGFLKDTSIASAACALVSAERRGKSWHVSASDFGQLVRLGASPGDFDLAQSLWRASYAVARPPRDLWITRKKTFKKWIGNRPPQRLTSGTHLCTTLITASYLAEPSTRDAEIRVPPAPDERATQIRTIYG